MPLYYEITFEFTQVQCMLYSYDLISVKLELIVAANLPSQLHEASRLEDSIDKTGRM